MVVGVFVMLCVLNYWVIIIITIIIVFFLLLRSYFLKSFKAVKIIEAKSEIRIVIFDTIIVIVKIRIVIFDTIIVIVSFIIVIIMTFKDKGPVFSHINTTFLGLTTIRCIIIITTIINKIILITAEIKI